MALASRSEQTGCARSRCGYDPNNRDSNKTEIFQRQRILQGRFRPEQAGRQVR